MTRHFAILFALAGAACAQSLVLPEHVPEIRQAFERAAGPPTLRCTVSPVKPTLTYGFRFHTGFELSFPLSQFGGAAHLLQVHVRVTPEGQTPVYLTAKKALPVVPDLKADGVGDGTLVVGEGTYAVELLLVDDEHRACRSTWQIQARRNGNERELAPTTPPLTVLEADAPDPAASKKPADIGRMTILLNAASLMPRRAKLQEDDIKLLTDSLGSLLRQWSARTVRLIAFNLSQRAVLVRD